MSAEKILSDWKKKIFKPIYWLEGEESYFIDQLMNYAEHQILTESEAGFNLTVFYGKDADWAAVINACMRYPMFAEKQVVLLREAQQMKDIEKLEGYIGNPLGSTIFVVSYKEKKFDARTKFAKLLKQKAEILSTKKLYENQLPDWTSQMVQRHGLGITPKALALLIDHIGNDLSRLQNEIEKLSVNLGEQKNIREEDIENFIGISKEFNVFELQNALAKKNLPKAIRIVQYFSANPKAGPIQQVLPSLYGFFSKVAMIFGSDAVDEKSLAAAMGINAYFIKDYLAASRNYGSVGTEKILLLLHHYNLRSIGINSPGTDGGELLKELVVKMIG